MAKAICSECGSPVEIAEGEEWGYCPMCENDQVELKRNLKLSLENAVEINVDKRNLESSEETDREINNFVKGLLYKNFIRLSYKVDVLEKSLELACKELHCELENPDNELYTKSIDEYIGYFKTKAKEIMKSE